MVTAVGWGLNWSVLKFVLQDWPPLFARGSAGLLGAIGLAAVAVLRGEHFAVPREARLRLAMAAGINVFAWMGFTALSLNWLKVSEGALIAYSMPIWAMLIAWPLHGERPNSRSLLALALGIAGIAVLMGGPDLAGVKLPGILFALAAAILFAIGTITARTPIPMPPTALTAWQVALGCLPMVILSLFLEQPRVFALSLPGLLGLAYMAAGPMALCYLTWFGALRRLPASVAATGMLLVPVVGVLSAIPLLGDSLGGRELIAIALTLSGVGLALRRSGEVS
ncbi:EamA-like transporter family protein [Bosea psychrotolerans]|uniref:EamA-like transporter family protein n=2 Tax=Bosea psychrotolerans TaxID=1871628 RepID=A0A2S4M4Q3_9HYPH|nr:EamA-like transporter family protein [Bosea psychrotolerans]